MLTKVLFFVVQVDYSVVPADLQHLFEKCGEIVRVKIMVDKMQRPKGYEKGEDKRVWQNI